jgi:endonuclease/exonuclease/phosphatase (EEP) superfamily protein YafD
LRVRRILGWALIPVLVVLALPSAVRLVGDQGWPPLVILDLLMPYALPLLIVLLAVFAILGRGVLSAIAGVLVLVDLLWLAPLFVGHHSSRPGQELTVVTANLNRGRADPVSVVELVHRTHADVLAVEELTPGEATALDKAGLKTALPYRVLTTGGGASGNGLYSRYPLTRLTTWQLTYPSPGAAVQVNAQAVVIRVVHTYPPVPWRPSASRHDWTVLRHGGSALPTDEPVIVAGDFNATRDVSGLRRVMSHGLRDAPEIAGAGLLRTWAPPHLPSLFQVDHVLVNDKVSVRSTSVVSLAGADHDALVARLTL